MFDFPGSFRQSSPKCPNVKAFEIENGNQNDSQWNVKLLTWDDV